MAHALFTNSMMHSTRPPRPQRARMAKSARKFAMTWMTWVVFPVGRSSDPMDAFDSRVGTNTTARAVSRMKPRAQKTVPSCIRSFTATIKTGSKPAIRSLTQTANWLAAYPGPYRVRRLRQNLARKLRGKANKSETDRACKDRYWLTACHDRQTGLEKRT